MSTTVVAQTILSGSRRAFPARGFWCVVDGKLAIIAATGFWDTHVVTEPNPHAPVAGTMQSVRKDRFAPDEPFAEIHFVETEGDARGETTEIRKNVPFDAITIATFEQLVAIDRANHVTELQARRLGYVLTEAELAEATAQETTETEGLALARKVAAHPDAVALNAAIAVEAEAFQKSVDERRTALFHTLKDAV